MSDAPDVIWLDVNSGLAWGQACSEPEWPRYLRADGLPREMAEFAKHDDWQALMSVIDDFNEGRMAGPVALGNIGLALLRLDGARRALLSRYDKLEKGDG